MVLTYHELFKAAKCTPNNKVPGLEGAAVEIPKLEGQAPVLLMRSFTELSEREVWRHKIERSSILTD